MKKCKVCKKLKDFLDFEKQRNQCKDCRKSYLKKNKIKWYYENREYAILKSKEWIEKNEEKRKENRKNEYYRNKEFAILASREYRKLNRAKVSHWSRLRQCSKAHRTPKWLSKEDKWLISEIYDLANLRSIATGIKWEVDHIIPLRGKTVSGLHVPENLQVITEKENKEKRNLFLKAES